MFFNYEVKALMKEYGKNEFISRMKGKWYKKSLQKAETYTSECNVDNREHFKQNLKVHIQHAYREIEVTNVFFFFKLNLCEYRIS